MLRRDFVRKAISFVFAAKVARAQQAAGVAPPAPAPVPWTQGLNARMPLPETVSADEVAQCELSFFTPPQMKTLTRLSDLLAPPMGDKPGAVAAQTPQFLDFLIGSSPEPRKKIYTGGLDWLEAESQSKYKTPFVQLNDEQAGKLIEPWLRTWMSDHPPADAHAGFINIAHDDIRNATVNSKAWSEAATVGAEEKTEIGLYWSPIEPDAYRDETASARLQPHVLAAPKAAHTMPIYPR